MTDLRLYLFGMPRLEYQGKPVRIERRKALALAAYLALADQRQSRDVLAGLLWPELDHEHARSALRSTLRALQTPVPLDWIEADRMTLGIRRDLVWIDAAAFLDLLNRSAAHGHDADTVCDACLPLLKQAVELYRSDLLAGFSLVENTDFEDWQLMQQAWLHREQADILRRLSVYTADRQQYEQAIKYALQWLAADPLHEPAHRQLMRLYAASGQRSEAVRQYRQCAALLEAELATPPEPETTQLYEAIQNDHAGAGTDVKPAAAFAAGVLPPLPPLVIGREEPLREIKRRLGIGSPEARAVTVIQGWPGVGKSTLVSLIAHDDEIARQYPDGVLWASLGENPDLLGEITAWADALRLNEPGQPRKIEDISAQVITALREKRVLLIVDDVWRPEHAAPFRVGGHACALVMTSRLNDVAAALAPTAADLYRLPLLSETAGLELLRRLAPETVAEHASAARQLIRDLEGLPLAVHVAGRLLHEETRLGWGVGDLLGELRSGAALLTAQVPSDMIGLARDVPRTVAALLKRSTDLLDAGARRRFAYLGLFVPKPATFDLEAMAAAWNVADARPVARVLVSRGLLEPVSGGRFRMHALLVAHARSLLETEAEDE